MTQKQNLMKELGINSPTTWIKWCKAHDIPSNKSHYTDQEANSLRACRKALDSGMKWADYLRSLGKEIEPEPSESLGSSLAQRYGKDIDKLSKPIAGGLVQALDNAVATEFTRLLRTTKSTVFGQLASAFTLELETTDPIALLEAEIIDVEDTTID